MKNVDLYINIGSVKACCFVRMSLFLIKKLDEKPLLYFAVEEALKCANMGYYGIGILAFSQLLNVFNQRTPPTRHTVAHEFLITRPNREMFNEIVEAFKESAKKQSEREQSRYTNINEYKKTLNKEMKSFISRLHELKEDELTLLDRLMTSSTE